MRHIRLALQYDGTDYSGWQVQKKGTTIQGLLEDALFAVTNERVRVAGTSRTDAGVHAIEQVAVFTTRSGLGPDIFQRALNANLPQDIRVIIAGECSADFHPRYNAKNKTYSYIISGTGIYSVFLRRYSWRIPYRLNCTAMTEASGYLTGKHDFSCFRASGCSSKNPVREIIKIEISEPSSIEFFSFKFDVPIVRISIQANAFLRHMARNIVGTLVEIGRDKSPASKIIEILDSKDRRTAGQTAPARGLFLEKITY